jgi:hypothetical protein
MGIHESPQGKLMIVSMCLQERIPISTHFLFFFRETLRHIAFHTIKKFINDSVVTEVTTSSRWRSDFPTNQSQISDSPPRI